MQVGSKDPLGVYTHWARPALLGLFLAFHFVGAQTAIAPLDLSAQSGAIPIFRRAETKDGRIGMTQVFPQNLDSVARLLGSSPLSDYDRHWLEDWEPGLRPEKIHWNDSLRGNSFFLRPEIQAEGDLTDDSIGNSLLGGVGVTLYGQALRHLTFYSHNTIYTQTTEKAQFTHQYDPEYGETYSAEVTASDSLSNTRTYNRHEYYLKYQGNILTVKVGRDWIHMGPGYFSDLMATRNTPPYFLGEARLDFAPWLYVDDYLIRMVDTRYDIQKYANIHRIEFKPFSRLSLGYEDIAIYQDRDPDPRYLLPLTPQFFTEENTGGEDNAAMMLDFLYVPIRNLSGWGEIFIDDLLGPTAFFNDWWENRWAALWGVQAVSPWKSVDADFVLEFSHVEPWTYIGREPQTSFKDFNVPSASKLGPDSRSWDVQGSYRPLRWLELKEHMEWNAKDTGRAGTLGVIHDNAIDGTGKKFLKEAKREFVMTESLAWIWNRYARLEAYWRQTWIDGMSNEGGGSVFVGW